MNQSAVLAACDHLIDLHAWRTDKINPRGWISNFGDQDKRLAAELLKRFAFYADPLVDQLYLSAFQSLSNIALPQWSTFSDAKTNWRNFISSALVTWVQGEDPNPADSGPIFIRKARQLLGISEAQLATPTDAVRRIEAGHYGPLVFVDDFVGSGEQFLTTWSRCHREAGGSTFKDVSQGRGRIYYCNLMTTEWGRERIASGAPEVVVAAGNIIPRTHTLSGENSELWPAQLLDEARNFVRETSARLGYTEAGGSEEDWEGFHKLGLGLAFEHSTPDATLPIFHSCRDGWTPLVRRS